MKTTSAFNRTFMELKLACKEPITIKISTFNRTFMELKRRIAAVCIREDDAFNRTFMELKLDKLFFLLLRVFHF